MQGKIAESGNGGWGGNREANTHKAEGRETRHERKKRKEKKRKKKQKPKKRNATSTQRWRGFLVLESKLIFATGGRHRSSLVALVIEGMSVGQGRVRLELLVLLLLGEIVVERRELVLVVVVRRALIG